MTKSRTKTKSKSKSGSKNKNKKTNKKLNNINNNINMREDEEEIKALLNSINFKDINNQSSNNYSNIYNIRQNMNICFKISYSKRPSSSIPSILNKNWNSSHDNKMSTRR